MFFQSTLPVFVDSPRFIWLGDTCVDLTPRNICIAEISRTSPLKRLRSLACTHVKRLIAGECPACLEMLASLAAVKWSQYGCGKKISVYLILN